VGPLSWTINLRKYNTCSKTPVWLGGRVVREPCRGQGVERLDAAVGYRGHGV